MYDYNALQYTVTQLHTLTRQCNSAKKEQVLLKSCYFGWQGLSFVESWKQGTCRCGEQPFWNPDTFFKVFQFVLPRSPRNTGLPRFGGDADSIHLRALVAAHGIDVQGRWGWGKGRVRNDQVNIRLTRTGHGTHQHSFFTLGTRGVWTSASQFQWQAFGMSMRVLFSKNSHLTWPRPISDARNTPGTQTRYLAVQLVTLKLSLQQTARHLLSISESLLSWFQGIGFSIRFGLHTMQIERLPLNWARSV